MEFTEDEVPLFRHRAQCKAKEGEVVVTAVRFVFIAAEGGAIKEFPWAAIQGIKYSPPSDPKGRAMVLLKTIMKFDEDIIVSLVGPTKEKNFAELETLKSIISKIRKKGSTANEGASSTKDNVGQKRVLDSSDMIDAKRRRQLLDHDRHLSKQYRDLVEVSKLLSEEDFWLSYASHAGQFGEVRVGDLQKGKQNSLLSDALASATNGVINLTVELKQNIFAMYPEVRRAFDAEVPLRRSETEFWTAYFQSEYYNNKMSTGGGSGGGALDSTLRDDLFARYVEQPSSSSQPKRKLDSQLLHPDIDLTASFGDYRSKENLDTSDIQVSDSTVSVKYNRNSTLVLGGELPKTGAAKAGCFGLERGNETILTELVAAKEPDYIQVHLQRGGTNHSETPGGMVLDTSGELRSKAAALLSCLQRNTASNSGALTGTCLPPADRANKFFATDVTKMRKQVLYAGSGGGSGNGSGNNGLQSALGSGSGAVSGDAGSIMGMLGIQDTSMNDGKEGMGYDLGYGGEAMLDEQFKQEMLEAFTEVTELLRHFYTVLQRAEASTTSTTGNSNNSSNSTANTAAAKAEAILQRLQEVNAKSLEAKKRQVSEVYRTSTEQREAALAVVNNVLLLIQRASVTWGYFSSGTSA